MTTKLKIEFEILIDKILDANSKDEITTLGKEIFDYGYTCGFKQFYLQIQNIYKNNLSIGLIDELQVELIDDLFAVYCEDMSNCDPNVPTADVVKLCTSEFKAQQFINKEEKKPVYKNLHFDYKKLKVE